MRFGLEIINRLVLESTLNINFLERANNVGRLISSKQVSNKTD